MAIRVFKEPRLRNPYLVVSWVPDVANLGPRVTGYLKKAIEAGECCEIEPVGFFALSGVAIEQDLVQFPSSRFFFSHGHELLILESTQPQRKHNEFLNLVLDMAQSLKVKRIYTVGGMASSIAHSARRRTFTVVNRLGLKREMARLGLETEMFYQGPPSISSFLLWLARSRGIDGVSLWQEMPFYLAAVGDWRAAKAMLEVLHRGLSLHFDANGLDSEVANQESLIEQLRQRSSEIDIFIRRLESGGELTQDELQKLAGEVAEFLSAS